MRKGNTTKSSATMQYPSRLSEQHNNGEKSIWVPKLLWIEEVEIERTSQWRWRYDDSSWWMFWQPETNYANHGLRFFSHATPTYEASYNNNIDWLWEGGFVYSISTTISNDYVHCHVVFLWILRVWFWRDRYRILIFVLLNISIILSSFLAYSTLFYTFCFNIKLASNILQAHKHIVHVAFCRLIWER